MRILHFFFFAILLKNVYCDSFNPLRLPSSPLSYLGLFPKQKASPFEVPTTNTKLDKVQQAEAPPPPSPSSHPSPSPRPFKVTSYILAVTWPPGACTGQSNITCKIKPMPTEFTIHGLWPQFPASDPPTKSIETFGNQLTTIDTEITKNWPDLRNKKQQFGDNLVLWKWEWFNHGIDSEMGVLDYFKKTLQLFRDVGQGLKGKLVAEGITPTDYRTHKLVDIEAALKKIYGFSCTIICDQRRGSTNVEQIQEIQFNFTTNFEKQNKLKPSTCIGPDVLFPLSA